MDNETKIKIIGDATSGIAASNEAAAAWERAGAIMREGFVKLGLTAKESFAVVGASAEGAATKTKVASELG